MCFLFGSSFPFLSLFCVIILGGEVLVVVGTLFKLSATIPFFVFIILLLYFQAIWLHASSIQRSFALDLLE